jgi:hypothetical protein
MRRKERIRVRFITGSTESCYFLTIKMPLERSETEWKGDPKIYGTMWPNCWEEFRISGEITAEAMRSGKPHCEEPKKDKSGNLQQSIKTAMMNVVGAMDTRNEQLIWDEGWQLNKYDAKSECPGEECNPKREKALQRR